MVRNRLLFYVEALVIIGCVVLFCSNSAIAGAIDLPKTGQTTCYNARECEGTGQDGEIQAGVAWPAPRFTDNGDGTITDNLTGLMWLKDGNCFSDMPWQEALDKVSDLNANAGAYTCGGYTATYNDWVLPNVNELESLINAEEPDPAVWLNEQGFVDVQLDRYYWSSTTSASITENAWVVYMSGGYVYNDDESFYYRYVWPVRAGQ